MVQQADQASPSACAVRSGSCAGLPRIPDSSWKRQNLNQHRDDGNYHNHPEYPNHTMNFGRTHYSVTLYTSGRLGQLAIEDWDSLGKLGFPICLYDIEAIKIRRLETEPQVSALRPAQLRRLRHPQAKNMSLRTFQQMLLLRALRQTAGLTLGRIYHCLALLM